MCGANTITRDSLRTLGTAQVPKQSSTPERRRQGGEHSDPSVQTTPGTSGLLPLSDRPAHVPGRRPALSRRSRTRLNSPNESFPSYGIREKLSNERQSDTARPSERLSPPQARLARHQPVPHRRFQIGRNRHVHPARTDVTMDAEALQETPTDGMSAKHWRHSGMGSAQTPMAPPRKSRAGLAVK